MLKKIENQECIIKIDEDIERFLQHQAIKLNMPFSSRTEVLKKFIHTLDVNISGQDPISFEMAQQYAKENQIKSYKEWRELYDKKQLPNGSPRNLRTSYPDKWVTWADFIGRLSLDYLPYDEAKTTIYQITKQHDIKLNLVCHWRDFCKSGLRPAGIPSYPDKIYKNNGWISWNQWLKKNPSI